jgi:hypothetical protein
MTMEKALNQLGPWFLMMGNKGGESGRERMGKVSYGARHVCSHDKYVSSFSDPLYI